MYKLGNGMYFGWIQIVWGVDLKSIYHEAFGLTVGLIQ